MTLLQQDPVAYAIACGMPVELVGDMPFVHPDPARPVAVVFDRDGTTASVEWAKDAEGNITDWEAYNGMVAFDAPVPAVVQIIRALRPGVKRLMVSGRMDHTAPAMLAWLYKHEIPVDHLFMRRSKDTRRDSLVKLEILQKVLRPRFDIRAVVDDRPQVIEMWRQEQLPVVVVKDPGIDPPILRGGSA